MYDLSVPPHLIRAAVAEWPDPNWPHWHLYDSDHQRKYASKDHDRLGPAARMLIERMAQEPIGAPRAFPDLMLHGAGLSMIREGGFIGWHCDAERHPLRAWKRVASACLFLTECEGGELEVKGSGLIRPQPGLFVALDGQREHRVHPVTSGERLSLNLFWWCKALDRAGNGSAVAAFTKSGLD